AYGSLAFLSFRSFRPFATENAPGPRTAHRCGATGLVDVDGGDEHRADRDALPEGLDADDDEAGLQHGGDEQADDGAEDRAEPAEDGRAADDNRGDDVEVRQRLPGDRRRAVLSEREQRAESGQGSRQRVHEHQMPRHLDAGTTG